MADKLHEADISYGSPRISIHPPTRDTAIHIRTSSISIHPRKTIPRCNPAAGGHLPAAELLLDRGADVNAANLNGTTPLDLCALEGTSPAMLDLLQKYK